MKHEKPEVMEIGLKSMWDLNDRISSVPSVCTVFYVSFYTLIIRETLAVMSDCHHLSGFKLECQIFQQLVKLAENNMILQPIQMADGQPHTFNSNREAVIELLISSIMEMFPNLNRAQVETFAIQLFNNAEDWKQFKGTLRDLMISMRSFASQENDFYEHQMKAEKEKAVKKDQEKKMMIPGMQKQP
jgi:exportin-1